MYRHFKENSKIIKAIRSERVRVYIGNFFELKNSKTYKGFNAHAFFFFKNSKKRKFTRIKHTLKQNKTKKLK